MNRRDDGGPAFPAAPFEWVPGGYGEAARFVPHDNTSAGMTLRDYFAASATEGEVSGIMEELGRTGKLIGLDVAGRFAAARAALADAMLAERAK